MRRSISAHLFGCVFAFAIAAIVGSELLPSSVSADDLAFIRGAMPEPTRCTTVLGMSCPQCTSNTCLSVAGAGGNGACQQTDGTPGCGEIGVTLGLAKPHCGVVGGPSAPCAMTADLCGGASYQPIPCAFNPLSHGCTAATAGTPGCVPGGATDCRACSPVP